MTTWIAAIIRVANDLKIARAGHWMSHAKHAAVSYVPATVWRGVQRKLKLLEAAVRLDDLLVPAGNRLEALKGDRSGRHSIRVNDRHRITFRWGNGHAFEVAVEDYH